MALSIEKFPVLISEAASGDLMPGEAVCEAAAEPDETGILGEYEA